MMKSPLSAEVVDAVFRNCLFREGEATEPRVEVAGITMTVGFHPDRLEGHREAIGVMLHELPEEFQKDGGGGWSFLNACMTKDGRQWGEHRNVEQLFLLGMAIGTVECQMPREAWSLLPGGMPYYVIA